MISEAAEDIWHIVSIIDSMCSFMALIQQVSHFLDHIVIDVAVAGECFGAFAVARQLAHEVWVFNLFVEVAYEGAS